MTKMQNQTQQFADTEEFLLLLSEDELASIAGGAPPPMPIPWPKPGPHRVSNAELDAIEAHLKSLPHRLNPLDKLQFGLKTASTAFLQ